jgi:hypothetical protein
MAEDSNLLNDNNGNPYLAVGIFDDDLGNANIGKINAMFETLMLERLHWLSPVWTGRQWNKVCIPQPNSWYRHQNWFDMGFIIFRTESLREYAAAHSDVVQGWHEDVWMWNFFGRNQMNEVCEHKFAAVVDATVFDNPPTRADGVREVDRNRTFFVNDKRTIKAERRIPYFNRKPERVANKVNDIAKTYDEMPHDLRVLVETC